MNRYKIKYKHEVNNKIIEIRVYASEIKEALKLCQKFYKCKEVLKIQKEKK